MSWFTSIAKAVVNSPVGKVLDYATTTFAHPIQVTKALFDPNVTVQQVVDKQFSQPVEKQYAQIGLATAGYAALAVGGLTTVGKTAISTVVKTLIPTTAKGAVITAAVGLPLAGAVISHPIETLDIVVSAPSKLANVGVNLANLGANPTLANVETLYKENPVITGVATGAAVIAGGLAAGNIISNITNTAAVKANTAATIESGASSSNPVGQAINIINQLPPASPPIPAVAASEMTAPAGSIPKKKVAKKKPKKKAKPKKKTRRSKKKPTKKKKKSIKRRKS
jgi:hypothetical protein